jgi:hypothetical protein
MDRWTPQINAMEKVFPETAIRYCLTHLSWNIRKTMGYKNPVYALFWPCMLGKIEELAYLKLIENELQAVEETKDGCPRS